MRSRAFRLAERLGFVAVLLLLHLWPANLTAGPERDPWDAPFAGDPAKIQKAVSALSPLEKGGEAEILLDESSYTFDAKGRATIRLRRVIRLVEESGVESWGSLERIWAPWYEERPVLRARVITSGGTVHTLDPKTIADAPAGDDSLEIFSDRQIVRAPLPALAVGAVIEQEILIRHKAPLFAAGTVHEVVLRDAAPIRRARVTVERPAALSLGYATRVLAREQVLAEERDGTARLSFEGGPFEGWGDEYQPGWPPEVPRASSISFATGRSWEEVASAYSEVVERQISGADLSRAAQEATAGAAGREEAILRLVSWLHRRVRYTGVEFGEAAIVPRSPAETLKRGYGDCKDKSVLLLALLRAAGMEARVALLNAQFGSDVEPELPGLGTFNHLIVRVEGDPAIWIDATAPFARPGELPEGDRGRLALLAGPNTSTLIPTPVGSAEENKVVETREFFLPEMGKGRVVATIEAWGAPAREYRSNYHRAGRKEVESSLESYVKSTYLGTKLGKFDHGDLLDLSRPFRLRIEVPEAGRGLTAEHESAVAFHPSGLLARLPWDLLPQDEGQEEDEPSKSLKPRTADYVLSEPYIAEWRYRVVPPPGFAPASLPESEKRALGPAMLAREVRVEPDGSVTALLRFEMLKPRITAAEREALIEEVRKVNSEEVTFLRFESVAFTHLLGGRMKESLEEFRRLVALHPKEALHHAQSAYGLVTGGLGEAARREARRAIEIEPRSAYAHRMLGWVLQHDMFGRRFGSGFDRADAISAYRKSLELDSSDAVARLDLAILLEHNARGERYGPGSDLAGAIAEYRSLSKDSRTEQVEGNLLIALLRAEKFDELEKAARGLPAGATRNQLLVAAVAGSRGAEVAIREAGRLFPDTEPRRQAIENAARMLYLVRRYPEAARLLTEGARGAQNASTLLTQADTIKKILRHEKLELSENDPRHVVTRLMISLAAPESPQAVRPITLFGRNALVSSDSREEAEAALSRGVRSVLRLDPATGLSPLVAIDTALQQSNYVVDGSDAVGYRVRLDGAGKAINYFVRREDGRFRIVAVGSGGAEIALETLDRVEAGDLPGARKWLDWAREAVDPAGGDDPLAGSVLPRFWAKGSNAGVEEIRLAAAALLAESGFSAAKRGEAILRKARGEATEVGRVRDLTLALAHLARSLKRHEELVTLSSELLAAHPDSDAAFQLHQFGLFHLRRFEEAKKASRDRLARRPDERLSLQTLIGVAMQEGDYVAAEKLSAALEEKGNATALDRNNRAWNLLYLDPIDEKALGLANRATETEPKSPASLHTLATAYAEFGQSVQAREALLESMRRDGRDEPASADWYVLGRIAEHYGELEAAVQSYRKVAKPENAGDKTSVYILAERRLSALRKSGKAAAKTL